MAVPGSGSLSLFSIANEKLSNDYNDGDDGSGPYSLRDITQGGDQYGNGEDYDVTNQQSPNHPDNVASFSMGEFYAYDHDFQAIPCSKAMDVVFLLDYTGSMGDDMQTLKTNVASISNKVVSESGGDYRLAAVLIDQTGGEDGGTPSYWTGNNTAVSNLASANKYNSGEVWLSALVPFANANKTDFDTKIGYLDGTTNSSTSMLIGSGGGGPEPNDTAIDRVLNHSLAGSFRSGVTRMIILITDNAPDGDGDDQFQGAEESAKMGTLTNQAVSNVCTISVLGTISNYSSSDGSTSIHNIYNAYATNTGGLTNFSGDPSDIVDFIEDICLDISAGFPVFTPITLHSTFIDSTPSDTGVSSSNVTETNFNANFVVTDVNNNTANYWKPWATNSAGTSFGDTETVLASKWTANGNVASSSTITSRGFVYGLSPNNLSTTGTYVTATGGTNTYQKAIVNNAGLDSMGWVYCNQGYSSTPSLANYTGTPTAGTGNQLAVYSGSIYPGTKSQTITENQVSLIANNTYKLRGWFEQKNNGGIVYSSNISSFTVPASYDFNATITVRSDQIYSTMAYGYGSSTLFWPNMGSMTSYIFNSKTITGLYFQDQSSTDYLYLKFSTTKPSFSNLVINGTSYGASSTWTGIDNLTWRKAATGNPMGTTYGFAFLNMSI
jgi:hypothetical protein